MLVRNCEICTLKYVHLLKICKMKFIPPKYIPFQEICTPPQTLYPFRKYVPLLEISTPKYVPQNMYPSWKFVHQNEISQVARIVFNFDTNIAPYKRRIRNETQKLTSDVHAKSAVLNGLLLAQFTAIPPVYLCILIPRLSGCVYVCVCACLNCHFLASLMRLTMKTALKYHLCT